MNTEQELLNIEFVDGASITYYIDKDNYSRAHRISPDIIALSGCCGTYTFNEATRAVTLFDGVKTTEIVVRDWKTIFE